MTPEAGFAAGLPLLLRLPLEVRENLVQVAKAAPSATAAFNRADIAIRLVSLPGRTQLERERIVKTIRWLAMIRLDNPTKPELFQNAVNMVLPATSNTSPASKAMDKEEKNV